MTKSLTCVVKDGKYKVAQYGQWDGYPGGQGATILEFLKDHDIKTFSEKLDNVRWITEKEKENRWLLCGASEESKWVTFEASEKHAELFPESSRDTGADILRLVANFRPTSENRKLLLTNDLDFAGDSLHCEWAYVVDLDKRTFEVYEGFCKTPTVGQRFSDFKHDDANFFPVQLVKSFELEALPTSKEFIAELTH